MEPPAVGQVDVDALRHGGMDHVAIGQDVELALPLDDDAGAGLFVVAVAVLKAPRSAGVGLDVDDRGADELGHRLDDGGLRLQDGGVLFQGALPGGALLVRRRQVRRQARRDRGRPVRGRLRGAVVWACAAEAASRPESNTRTAGRDNSERRIPCACPIGNPAVVTSRRQPLRKRPTRCR